MRCPKHRRKFNGGGLYFSLSDGSSHVHGDASSCRKYKPGWVVPRYDVSVGEGGAVLVARRGGADAGGAAAAARAPRKGSRWEQWAIAKVERVSPDSAIFHFGRASPTTAEQPQAPGGPSSWHVAMRLRYTKRPGSRKQKKVDRDYTPLSSLSEWAGGAMAILIKIYADGKLTSRLAAMDVGALVEFAAPEPTLRLVPCIALPDAEPSPQLGTEAGPWSVGMVAGGTGIAPIWQLLSAMRLHPACFGGAGCSARLVYSNTRREGILLRAELAGLAQAAEGQGALDFKCLHTLTGAGVQPEGWDETSGRINQAMLLSALPRPSPRTVVVVCGPAGMNEAAMRILRGCGYAEHMLVELEA